MSAKRRKKRQSKPEIITKIYRTATPIPDDPELVGIVPLMETIEYEGKFWLVPEWTVFREQGYLKPDRIILLDNLPHTKSDGTYAHFFLKDPLPKYVCDGQIPSQEQKQYVVIEAPDIKVRDPRALH